MSASSRIKVSIRPAVPVCQASFAFLNTNSTHIRGTHQKSFKLLTNNWQSDIPAMAHLFVVTLGGGPSGEALFPSKLKTKPGNGNQYDWRVGVLQKALITPGIIYMVALDGDKIIAWTQFIDLKLNKLGQKQYLALERGEGHTGPTAGLDLSALALVRGQQGALIEKVREIMGSVTADEALCKWDYIV